MKDQYQIITTADGSPTLHWSHSEAAEHMHHSGGALSESLYIYHQALEEVLKRGWPVRLFSLGLGLGYNELIALATLRSHAEWKIWSYEAVPLLREGFRDWLHGRPCELESTYNEVEARVAAHFKFNSLRQLGQQALEDGRLEIRGAFPQAAEGMQAVTCVFYDAYSKKMNPELWSEAELSAWLLAALDPRCVLTTYAATGALNRVLKGLGFQIQKKLGFAGKRESTLALRGD